MGHDPVNSPSHYTSGGIETIDYIKAKLGPVAFEGFLAGNVIKYVSRYQHKNGIEDLEKSKWYIDRLIAELNSSQPREEFWDEGHLPIRAHERD